MSCQVSVATLLAFEMDSRTEESREMEHVLSPSLSNLPSKHPMVTDVRGIGVYSVRELVKDWETRDPLATWNGKASESGAKAQVAQHLRRHGLRPVVTWNWISVAPPASINAQQIAAGLPVMHGALKVADASLDCSPPSQWGVS